MRQPLLLDALPVEDIATSAPTPKRKRNKATTAAEEAARSQAFLDTWRRVHLHSALRDTSLDEVIAAWHEVNVVCQ